MKKAKKIIGLILFLGIGFVMFIMISYVLRPRMDGSDRKYFTGFYEAEKDSLDIITLGSSGIYRYFNNPILFDEYGLTSYNLSTSLQPVEVLENLVDEVHKTQSPQLFIVEVRQFVSRDREKGKSDGEINEIALRRVTDNMNYSWNRVLLINKTVEGFSERMGYYFDIIRYHDNWESLDMEALDFVDNKEAPKLNGWRNIFTIEEIELPQMKDVTDRKNIPDTSEEVLLSFIEKCKKEKIEVLFIASPWQLSEEEMEQNNYVGDIIRESGFDFLDCNLLYEEIGLDPKVDFYDTRHTNVWGAEKFTRYLAEYIQDTYDVSGTHTDSVIATWNQIVQYNESNMEKGIANHSSGTVDKD